MYVLFIISSICLILVFIFSDTKIVYININKIIFNLNSYTIFDGSYKKIEKRTNFFSILSLIVNFTFYIYFFMFTYNWFMILMVESILRVVYHPLSRVQTLSRKL